MYLELYEVVAAKIEFFFCFLAFVRQKIENYTKIPAEDRLLQCAFPYILLIVKLVLSFYAINIYLMVWRFKVVQECSSAKFGGLKLYRIVPSQSSEV